jgi:hypothetical protein
MLISDSQNYLTLMGITTWKQRGNPVETSELPLLRGSRQIGRIYLSAGLSRHEKLLKLLGNILKAIGCHTATSLQPDVTESSEQIVIVLGEKNELILKPDADSIRHIGIPFSDELLHQPELKRDLWKVLKKNSNYLIFA